MDHDDFLSRGRPPQLDPDVESILARDVFEPRPDDEALLERVRGRLMCMIAAEQAGSPHITVRADDDGWELLQPGVRRKVLHETDSAISCLMRLDAGVVMPGHQHPIDEECLVLEGTLRIGTEVLLHAGDFHVGREGVDHAQASTDTGTLLYLRAGKSPGAHAGAFASSAR
jgi:quercetin dioxygenase-like cupin family protein